MSEASGFFVSAPLPAWWCIWYDDTVNIIAMNVVIVNTWEGTYGR
ncbi:MAG TPA: hypothetical protein VKB76_20495 [Ktedonobacterales bacterium]|nr:hypothetical protein [Ktedonobacterales bacterium]